MCSRMHATYRKTAIDLQAVIQNQTTIILHHSLDSYMTVDKHKTKACNGT